MTIYKLSLSYSLQSRKEIFNGNMLDQQGRNYFNVPSQTTAKPGVAEANSSLKDMEAFTMFS